MKLRSCKHPKQLALEVLERVRRGRQLARLRPPQRERDRVDREVAAQQILLEVAGLDVGQGPGRA